MTKASLSVCAIYGNESVHIDRFIESFLPIADEFVFVRAIGARDPDDSLEKIKAKCSLEGAKLVLSEYENQTEESKKWPHVDRFDKARQLSFDLSTSDLTMWADLDDILPPNTVLAIAAIKSLPKRPQWCVGLYSLPSMDQEFWRERIIERGTGRWMSPVHETIIPITPQPPTIEKYKELVIEHRPVAKPMLSVDRNLKILEHSAKHPNPDDWGPQIWFYIHRDSWIHPEAHENRGIERSVEAGLKAITFKDLGAIERYEVYLNLCEALAQYPRQTVPIAAPLIKAKSAFDSKGAWVEEAYKTAEEETSAILAESYKLREKWLINAIRISPDRREAFAAMSILERDRKAYGRELAWAHAMRGIPEPYFRPWTHQKAFYSWKGALIMTLAYRDNNLEEKARQIEEHVFGNSGRWFSILHATRRADDALKAMYFWLSQADNASAIEWIFAVDEDDQETIKKLHGYRVVKVSGKDKGPVAAWNAAAKESSGKILVQMSDDWIPCLHWDLAIASRLSEKIDGEAALQISDGHRKDDLMCMAILTRKYYDRYGYVFYPEYFSMYSDNEFTLQAQRDGVIVEAKDIVFQHAHPVFQGKKFEEMDAVYQRSNASENYQSGKKILDSRMSILKPDFVALM